MTVHPAKQLRKLAVAAEAGAALAMARLTMVLPFRWIVARDDMVTVGVLETVRPPDGLRVWLVGRMVVAVGDRLPWTSTCLVRALAARMMPRRRGIPSVLRFGVCRTDGRLTAHAWLEAGGGTVCGGREAIGLAPLAGFASRPDRGH